MKTLLLVVACSLLAMTALAADKPTVLIMGEGNVEINSDGSAVGGWHWATGFGSTRVNKHNQTMEMAQNYLQHCPSLEVTLDGTNAPDYYVELNREGGAYNIGQSQIMVLNRRKTVIFVAKTMTVKNAVRNSCSAITADFEKNGRLPLPASTSATPMRVDQPRSGSSLCGKWYTCTGNAAAPTSQSTSAPQKP